MIGSLVLPRFELPRAGRALAALLRDPDDLPQVFTLVDSLSGFSPHRMLFGFRRTPSGARLLRDRPDIVPTLIDRAGLSALPEGSLGRAYLAFVEREGITPEGIKKASEGQQESRSPEFAFMHARMRDTHDLWHAATGYSGDVLGELALLAFSLAQNWHTGGGLIVVAAHFKGLARNDTHAIRDGHRRGRAAAWLPSQEWEALLPLPLGEVRTRLKLGAPPVYTPIRTTELRAEGVI